MSIQKSILPDVYIPDDLSFSQFFFQNFDKFANNVATVDALTGAKIIFKDFRQYCRNVASALTKRNYVKGDVVCLLGPNSPDYCIAFHGLLAAGYVVTPINPQYTPNECTHQLKDSGAKLIIASGYLADKVKEIVDGLKQINKSSFKEVYLFGDAVGDFKSFDELKNDDCSAFPDDLVINPKEDLAVIPYSSGTTGLPKGVMLTHHNLIANICQMTLDHLLKFTPEDAVMAVLPFFHIYGMVVIMSIAIFQGARIVIFPKFDPKAFLEAIQNFKITILPLVPPLILFLAKHPLVDKFDLSSVKEIYSGAAPLGADQAKEVCERLNIKMLRQGYGLTELSPVSHFVPSNGPHLTHGHSGTLIPNSESKIIDVDTGALLPIGQDGEVCVRGPQVMKGYFNNVKATSETIDADGFLHTGDIGHINEDHLIYITDRLKELIKCKGFQVPPAQLESILLTHPKIQDCAVIGKPDERSGEVPKAFVVLRANTECTEDEVADFLKGKVAHFKQLAAVEFIKEIPKSASGKILRRVLKQREIDAANN